MSVSIEIIGGPVGHDLIRLGPPSKGDTIHRAECRFAQRSNALHWTWAEGRPLHEWVLGAPWLHACQVCRPDLPREVASDEAGR